jgi:hypothetical protein
MTDEDRLTVQNLLATAFKLGEDLNSDSKEAADGNEFINGFVEGIVNSYESLLNGDNPFAEFFEE